MVANSAVSDSLSGKQAALARILSMRPVIPVVTILDPESAVPLAGALRAGGLDVIEVMLRSPAAEASIARIARELPGVIVGAGTVTEPAQLDRVQRLGARFAVSPGYTRALIAEASRADIPLLPGASTVSEMMTLLESGFTHQKFFPAEASGGARFLRAVLGPLPTVRFCPTGGIDAANAPDYLACPNVACVGGSWMAPVGAVAARAWSQVEGLAREAAGWKASHR